MVIYIYIQNTNKQSHKQAHKQQTQTHETKPHTTINKQSNQNTTKTFQNTNNKYTIQSQKQQLSTITSNNERYI